MMRLTFFILFTCTCFQLQAQVNLVKNPGFEDISRCPYNFDQIRFSNYWSGIDTNYVQNPELMGVDSFGSPFCAPDLCHSCADVSGGYIVSVPYGSNYWQYPHSGNAFAEVNFFSDEIYSPPSPPWRVLHRDYLFGRLTQALTAGKRYQVRFYANLAEQSGYAIANLEAYLDDGTIVAHGDSCNKPQSWAVPQVSNSSGIIADTMNWVKVEGTFSANGTERFITIGNFKNKANTQYQPRQYYIDGGFRHALYLIDDVSVIPCDLAADGGGNRAISPGDSTYIGRAPEPGLDCTWYLGSDSIGSGAGIWVKPDTTTTYRVVQRLCGISRSDEVTVYVWPAGLDALTMAGYNIYPSPNRGSMNIRLQGRAEGAASVIISDMRGAAVYKGELRFKDGAAQLHSGITAPGLYLLRLEDSRGRTFVQRFVVE